MNGDVSMIRPATVARSLTDGTSTEQEDRLLRLMVEKTQAGQLRWEPTARERHYIAVSGRGPLFILTGGPSDAGDDVVRLEAKDRGGRRLLEMREAGGTDGPLHRVFDLVNGQYRCVGAGLGEAVEALEAL